MKVRINKDKVLEYTFAEKETFAEAKLELENKGYRIGSLEEKVKLDLKLGPGSEVVSEFIFLREGVIYVPKKGIYITKKSPILENPPKVSLSTSSNEGPKFYLTKDQVRNALKDAYFVSKKSCDIKIPGRDFGEEGLTNFLFGKRAEAYGQFMSGALSYENVNFEFHEFKGNKPYVRPFVYEGLGNNSDFSGSLFYVGDGVKLLGIKDCPNKKIIQPEWQILPEPEENTGWAW